MTNKQLLERVIENQKIIDAKLSLLLLNAAVAEGFEKISVQDKDVKVWEQRAEKAVS